MARLTITEDWRAVVLASHLALGMGSIAQAHSLPGSVLEFSQADQNLNLSITLSLHDLKIAAHQFASLSNTQVPYDLTGESVSFLAEYLSDHLQVQHGGNDLTFTIASAFLDTAEHEDVGSYTTLAVALASPIDAGAKVFPLTLRYDAIMHEVRNHRALVLWVAPNEDRLRLAEFGYQPTGGQQKFVTLTPH